MTIAIEKRSSRIERERRWREYVEAVVRLYAAVERRRRQ